MSLAPTTTACVEQAFPSFELIARPLCKELMSVIGALRRTSCTGGLSTQTELRCLIPRSRLRPPRFRPLASSLRFQTPRAHGRPPILPYPCLDYRLDGMRSHHLSVDRFTSSTTPTNLSSGRSSSTVPERGW